jgi:uroporphyrinogen decarboxylase
VEDPELLRGVCGVAQDAHLRNLRAMLEHGITVVIDSWFQCGPSVGWSIKTYEDFFLPLVREAVELAHEFNAIYIYQDDGRMNDLLPYIVEAGVDVISGLQPPDVGDVVLKDAKSRFGDKVALLGGLDPCYTFDMGTPDTVRDAVRQAISDAAQSGGYVLGVGESIDPMTPRESIEAMAKAAEDFGMYGRDI